MPSNATLTNVPQCGSEIRLCRAFEKALHQTGVERSSDFLALGGNAETAAEIARTCRVPGLTADLILKCRTPEAIIHRISENELAGLGISPSMPESAPLTDSQLGVYLPCMLAPQSTMYNLLLPYSMPCPEGLTAEELVRRVNLVLKAHPMLYCRVDTENDPVRFIRMPFPKEGLCTVCGALDTQSSPFDLKKGPLCRVQAMIDGGTIHFLIEAHHLSCDGSSSLTLFHQLERSVYFEEAPAPAADAFLLPAILERAYSEKQRGDAKEWFRKLLSGVECDSTLPFDHPDANPFPLGTQSIQVRPEDLEQIGAYLRETGIAPSTFYLGVFGYVLAKLTGQSESLFCTLYHGRDLACTDSIVSLMVRTLPVHASFDEEKPADEYLRALQEQFRSSMRFSCQSFMELSNEYGLKSSIFFGYQNNVSAHMNASDVQCDFSLFVCPNKDECHIEAIYRGECYESATISRFIQLYVSTALSFAKGMPLKEISLCGREEAETQNSFFHTIPYPREATLISLFQESARKYPDKDAVVFGEKHYTYAQTDALTDRLAAFLCQKGIGRGDTVGVLIPRCEWMVLCSLGVLKAGGVLLPLDPSYPPERLSLMCEDSSARLVIAEEKLLERFPSLPGEKVPLSALSSLPEAKELPAPPSPEDCYILLYTSGTTGRPKGCRLIHRNMVAFCAAYTSFQHADASCRMTAYSSFGFDACMLDLYPALSVGASVYVIPEEMRLNFPMLKDFCEQNGITHMCMTTQVSRQFACEYPELKPLRYLTAGGEKLAPFPLPKTFRFVNMYGPTEGTIAATGLILEKEYSDIPIGGALPNMRLFVVDPYGRRLPRGVPGELVLCGPQVSAGYLNRPEVTEKVFVRNRWDENPEPDFENCYKTGDIVALCEDGMLKFIGRRDLQVKIRGFRIELSEVEQVIREYPGITGVTVVAREQGGSKCLHAYIVSPQTVDIGELNRFIRDRKPPYMVPAATLQIERIPLTPNLKVDKRALPPIERAPEAVSEKRSMTKLEEELSELLKTILGHGEFSVETDLSDAGLTSISSIRFSVQLYKRFALRVESRELLSGMNLLTIENRIVQNLLTQAASPAEKSAEAEKNRERAPLRRYPLTQTQLGIYLDCMRAGMDAYNIPMLLKLPDSTDPGRLRAALQAAVSAHPVLNCRIHTDENGEPAAYPGKDGPVELYEENTDTLPPEATRFAFGDGPLFRARLIHHQKDLYLLLEVHHIIADGESLQRLTADIDTAYHGGKPESESYTAYDLALDEQKARAGKEMEEARQYYESVFSGISSDYQLNPDRHGKPEASSLTLQAPLSPKAVENFCAKRHISASAFFTGAFALTLSRFTSHEDAAFATIYSGRDDPRCSGMCGMLVKTLPVYLQAEASLTAESYLQSVEERLRLLRRHDLYSFADAARDFGVKADMMLIYQGRMMQDIPFLDGKLQLADMPIDGLKSDFSTEVYEEESGYRLQVSFNSGRYGEELARSFTDAFLTAARELLMRETLGEISVTSPEALHRFDHFNATSAALCERPIYRVFEEAADRYPERDAVRDTNGRLSYRQLDRMTNALAANLLEKGVAPGSVVEIIVDRIKEIYVAQLGILKAASAFLCLSPDYPDERIRFVSEDAKTAAVITTHAVFDRRAKLLSGLGLPVIFADDIPADTSAGRLELPIDPNALCYLIYTSGSTGKPKGVMVSHHNLLNLVDPNERNPQTRILTEGPAVCSAVTAFTFDASIDEGLNSLCNGCTVCIADEDAIHDPIRFREFCLSNGITSLIATPPFLLNMLDYEPFGDAVRQLKVSLCGGENYPERLYERLRELNPSLTIVNSYGPSEATITCSFKVLTSSDTINIGVPNANTGIYILDKAGHILPMGALGEMIITGDGVGLGYLNRPDLTEKSFFTLRGERAYRTGDLALITHSGEIEYHGRLDNQVKLRGLRVELGEIESAINAIPGVKNSVVTLFGDESNRYLAGYYTAEHELSPESVRGLISSTLSEYMVPRVLMQLPEMPLTANGKIDRRALPAPQQEQRVRAYEPPRNEQERKLCEIFQRVLNLKQVGATDDFFELGGTSLSATKVAMMSLAAGLQVVYADVFKHPTARELAALQTSNASGGSARQTASCDSEIDTVLSRNVWHIGDDPGHRELGNVLVTGVTGFLGMHVLKQLLRNSTGEIYCLLHDTKQLSAIEKLKSVYFYYFDTALEGEALQRVHAITGDIADEGIESLLSPIPFDTLINCAACVKHFANSDILERVNVKGVENLIRVCKATGRRMIHVSTVSVAGEGREGQPPRQTVLHENELWLNQLIENSYIDSKFRSEKAMLAAISQGLDGKIMRAGNLMPRRADGEFQINFMTNGFMRRLRAYYALGCIPYSALETEFEFSPIDETASVLLSLSCVDRRYSVFHINNTHRVYLFDVIQAMNDVGLKVATVTENEFMARVRTALQNAEDNEKLSGLFAYLNHDADRYHLNSDNSFTHSVLNRLGCHWSIINEAYLRSSLSTIRDMGFFELDL